MINLNHIHFGYRSKQTLLRDLTLQIAPGHIYGLLGRNGVGKTSLMHILCGLLFPDKGECTVLGSDPAKRSVGLLQQIFFLPDDADFPPGPLSRFLSLNIPFYPSFSGVIFYQLIAEFGIGADVYPSKLSLGQRKQIALCFALATRAKVLLLDEPTNGLDIPSKKIFRKIIAGTFQDEQIIVISTHQVKDLESLIDHILILDDQQLVIDHSIDVITEKLAFKYVADGSVVRDAIYIEKGVRGSQVLAANKDRTFTKFDMELFFNAVLNERERLSAVLDRR